jgi:hypothetical protein
VYLTQKQIEQVIQALEEKPKLNQYLLNYLREISKKQGLLSAHELDDIPF